MPTLTPTVDDIKNMAPWEAGKYRAKVLSQEELVSKPNKDTGITSLNNWVVFQIVSEGPMEGRKHRHCFSQKFTLPALNFFKALGARIEPGVPLDWEKTEGRELYIMITLKMYEGRPQPNIVDFFPVD